MVTCKKRYLISQEKKDPLLTLKQDNLFVTNLIFLRWLKTKLSRRDSHGSQQAGIAVRTLRPDEFSYSGANSLKKMSDLNNGIILCTLKNSTNFSN